MSALVAVSFRFMFKVIVPLIVAAGLSLGVAYADPSQTGLANRNSEFSPTRTGFKNKPIHNVPDTGNTLALLGLAVVGLLVFAPKTNRNGAA